MYYTKVKINSPPNTWTKTTVEIYNKETDQKVHEYNRNYSFLNTFFPFSYKNNWYALYSYNYTSTAIMSLPDGKIVAEEEKSPYGFCPVDFFIPSYQKYKHPVKTEEELNKYPQQNHSWLLKDRCCRDYECLFDELVSDDCFVVESLDVLYNINFGFVAGCVWGDDSSWKVQRLDLSNFLNGKIKRTQDYGYIELAMGQSLKEAIHIHDAENDEDDYLSFKINVQKGFSFNKNKIEAY